MARPESLSIVHFDQFTLLFHRASGITHLVTSPAPEILAEMGEAGLTLRALVARLTVRYRLVDADLQAVEARLRELVGAGLIAVS